MITSRRMISPGHVARMGDMRNAYRVLVGKPERKRPLGRPSCRGKLGGRMWIGFILLKTGPVVGSCEYGNETSGSIKGREFD
jgi:hypothetical protein